VLEGLSGIPFPRDDGVCTRFPTEIIITHDEHGSQTITASIIPHNARTDASKAELKAFSRSIQSFDELPEVISSAGTVMGLRGFSNNDTGPSFSMDVLQIKVSNQSGLHLSIVDLPGLIAVASDVQTEADVETVQHMVTSYIEKPRTIILAVVQAGNDIANQSIIRKSKEFDKTGRRTVGIITKPDLINERAEIRIAALAKGHDTTKLKLGFYLLKNPNIKELEDHITAEQRIANELRFFNSSPWKEQGLDPNRVGIVKLKENLQHLLDDHIGKELPKVREEIKARIKVAEAGLATLPVDRPTTSQKRMFLSDLAVRYQGLTSAALNGDYSFGTGEFFAVDENDSGLTRLRASVHRINSDFAYYMQHYGRTTIVCDDPSKVKRTPLFMPSLDIDHSGTQTYGKADMASNLKTFSFESEAEQDDVEYDNEVSVLTHDQMNQRVLKVSFPGISSTICVKTVQLTLIPERCIDVHVARNFLAISTPRC
jgi:hypothetical protein